MKRAVFFLAVLSAAVPAEDPPKPEPLLDARTRAKLEEALGCVNLTTADLGWNKRPIDDDFRLQCVNDTLDRPLALADYAGRAEKEFGADPWAAVNYGAAWLDVVDPLFTIHEGDHYAPKPDVSDNTNAILKTLTETLAWAESSRTAALQRLTPQDLELLKRAGSRAYVDDSAEEDDPNAFLTASKMIRIRDLFLAAVHLSKGIEPARSLSATAQAPANPLRWEKDGRSWSIGGAGPDRHHADVVLDFGGDDLYENCTVVLDLGGDDTYLNCASGLFACGLTVDLAGNDRYLGGNFSQGGAAFGASILFDLSGDDRYEADQVSQGAGVFGVGMLFDLDGNDGYRGARFVQGFGGVKGLGVLSDVKGNDTYYAGGKYSHAPLLPENFQSLSQGFGFGMRPVASGGVGILADHAGNDVYAAEVFGQGASYWYALGVLADSAGHDKYVLYQYGQGSGIHLSSGVLFDRAGNDSYACNNGVAQGCGHDWAAGMLLDLAGDDYYTGAGMTQGGANANGLGILIDRRGNDGYSGSRPEVQGFSFQSRGSFGLGVLLDLDGKDKYSENGRDNLTWTKTTLGVGLDSEEKK